ncbi:baseplate J/gp47 family protein [Thermus sp. SYSU G05001]|uniref:Baseplate J/gp47 family protein n=1 Tax=Thermus brevis TaxID=2862456 RepID=A0ABS7A174_9DEIN|nr:baseplate J/gp47 family protein [Thermus brevis]MBW6396025.1 baseplate J/gp47 family protein [Thermus brevis]
MLPTTFRTMEDLVAEMLQWYWYRTGVEPAAEEGDILRTLLEAVGYEMERLTAEFDRAIEQAVPEGVFAAFGFSRLPARPARLTLRFSRATPAPEDILIPEGTRAQTPTGIGFRTTQDALIPAGGTQVDVPAEAEVPGAAGNVPAGAVSEVKDALPGVEAVTNTTPGTGGQDEETLDAQQARFARYIASLAKGTLMALEAAALSARTPQGLSPTAVLAVDRVRDPSIPLGEVRVYVDADPNPTPELLGAVGLALEDVRPAGVVVSVLSVTKVPVNVRLRLEGASPSQIPSATQSVYTLFSAMRVGEDVVRERLVAAVAAAVPEAYAVRVLSPASDVVIGPYERATLGTLQVEVA